MISGRRIGLNRAFIMTGRTLPLRIAPVKCKMNAHSSQESSRHATNQRRPRHRDAPAHPRGAHRAMLAGGYRGTTMPAIAAEADVSVGLLYRYFESKEELYLAMCESVTQAQLDELAVQLARSPIRASGWRSAVGHFVESLEAERWGAIITTGWAEADINPALRDMLRRRCDQIRAFAHDVPARGRSLRGELEPEADVEELSLATTMLMDGVIAHQAEMGDRFDPALVERSSRADRTQPAPEHRARRRADPRSPRIIRRVTRRSGHTMTVLAPATWWRGLVG